METTRVPRLRLYEGISTNLSCWRARLRRGALARGRWCKGKYSAQSNLRWWWRDRAPIATADRRKPATAAGRDRRSSHVVCRPCHSLQKQVADRSIRLVSARSTRLHRPIASREWREARGGRCSQNTASHRTPLRHRRRWRREMKYDRFFERRGEYWSPFGREREAVKISCACQRPPPARDGVAAATRFAGRES